MDALIAVLITASLAVLLSAMVVLVKVVRTHAHTDAAVTALEQDVVEMRVEAELMRRTSKAFAFPRAGLLPEPLAGRAPAPGWEEDVYRHVLSRMVTKDWADRWDQATSGAGSSASIELVRAAHQALFPPISGADDFAQAWQRSTGGRRATREVKGISERSWDHLVRV